MEKHKKLSLCRLKNFMVRVLLAVLSWTLGHITV